jgi:hypothetical protein
MAKGREHGAEGGEEKRFERHRAESMEQRAVRKSALNGIGQRAWSRGP